MSGNIKRVIALVIILIAGLSGANFHLVQASGSIIRVAADGGSDPSCGLDWATPCNLQYALQSRVTAGDEIWVKAGTYTPSGGSPAQNSFNLVSGVSLYGGFKGNETDRAQRDFASNVSKFVSYHDTYYTYRVLMSDSTSPSALIDGITIADMEGIYNQNGSLIIRNTIFRDLLTGLNGAGVDNWNGNVDIEDSTFLNNSSYDGGAIYNSQSTMRLKNVVFQGNSAPNGYAGVMWNLSHSVVDMENVSFIGNTAKNGGAIFNDESTTNFTNCTFYNNSASEFGGAIVDAYASTVVILSSTFYRNTSSQPGASVYIYSSKLTIKNSIIWDTQQAPFFDYLDQSVIGISYSDISGGYSGMGNLNADPFLSTPGYNGGFTPTISLPPNSPVIDQVPITECKALDGSLLSRDQRDGLRPIGVGCDMGAFEMTPFTIRTYLPVIQR